MNNTSLPLDSTVVEKLENDKDLLEKEKILRETEIKVIMVWEKNYVK